MKHKIFYVTKITFSDIEVTGEGDIKTYLFNYIFKIPLANSFINVW